MRKKLFYGFTLFVTMFMLVAWQFAEAELADIQCKNPPAHQGMTAEIALS